jgi:hypothetical protein
MQKWGREGEAVTIRSVYVESALVPPKPDLLPKESERMPFLVADQSYFEIPGCGFIPEVSWIAGMA